MSYQRKEGKDTIIFLSEKESNEPAKVSLQYDKDDEEHMGLIRPDGEINWNCPCLQGMADGPCGTEFRESFSCFHYSQADPKGSDCIDQFRSMQECFTRYPEVYSFDDDKEVNEGDINNSQDANKDQIPSIDSQNLSENSTTAIGKTEEAIESSPTISGNTADNKNIVMG